MTLVAVRAAAAATCEKKCLIDRTGSETLTRQLNPNVRAAVGLALFKNFSLA